MSKRKRNPARQGLEDRTAANGVRHYRGMVFDRHARGGKGALVRGRWTPNLAEARAWRVDALARLQARTLSGDRGPLLRDAAEEFIEGIHDGSVCTRSGAPYKPSAARGYTRDLRGRRTKRSSPTTSNTGPAGRGQWTLSPRP